MNASPVLKYLAKDDLPSPTALGPVSMLRAFAASVGKQKPAEQGKNRMNKPGSEPGLFNGQEILSLTPHSG